MRFYAHITAILVCILGMHYPDIVYSKDETLCKANQDFAIPTIKPDFVKWMNSLPKDMPAVSNCETVEISSKQNTSYGQGSTFKSVKEPNNFFILTAAHVVSNSDDLSVECNGKKYKAFIRGISETSDLAILVLEENPKEMKPLFIWEGKKLPIGELREELETDHPKKVSLGRGSHYIQTASKFVAPSEDGGMIRLTEKGPQAITDRIRVETKLVLNPAEHPLIGSELALAVSNVGVRPGMSGSPIVYSVRKLDIDFSTNQDRYTEERYLSGVLIKTYTNNTESIAVPIETINKYLPELLEGRDVSKSANSPYYFEKKIKDSVEIPTLTFVTENGKKEFEAICPGPFSNTSGKSGAGDSGGKGGSGDSGGKSGAGDSSGKGGSGDSGGKSGAGDSGGKKDESFFNTSSYSLYRNRYGCRESGIKDSNGNVYLAIKKEDGSISKTESFEDISDLIQKYGSKFPEYIEKNGLKKNDTNEMFDRFCSSKNLTKKSNTRIALSRRDFDPANPEVAGYSTSFSAPNGVTTLEVTCDSLFGKKVSIKASRGNFKVDLTIKPDSSWSGTVDFRGCQSSISKKSDSPWFLANKDENLDMEISFSPDDQFLSFNIFSTAKKCLTTTEAPSMVSISSKPKAPTEVWLSKVDITFPKEKEYFYPSSLRDYNKDLNSEERAVIDSDLDLYEEAVKNLKTNRKRTEEIIKILEERESEEIVKARYRKPVAAKRLSMLSYIFKNLEAKMMYGN